METALLATKDIDKPGEIADYRLVYKDAFGREFESRIDGVLTPASRYVWGRLD